MLGSPREIDRYNSNLYMLYLNINHRYLLGLTNADPGTTEGHRIHGPQKRSMSDCMTRIIVTGAWSCSIFYLNKYIYILNECVHVKAQRFENFPSW